MADAYVGQRVQMHEPMSGDTLTGTVLALGSALARIQFDDMADWTNQPFTHIEPEIASILAPLQDNPLWGKF